MSTTTIILIAVFGVCGLFLLWAIKNGNNIKFKKKEKKSKDKFKDVIPKEKPEKKKPEKIRKAVKDEKSGKAEPPTNKIVKVTKEDFKSNDIEIPKTMEEKKPDTQKTDKKDEFNIDDFDLEKEMEALGITPPNFNKKPSFEADFNDFGAPMQDPYMFSGINDLDFGKEFMSDPIKDDFDFKPSFLNSNGPKTDGTFVNESIDARFAKIFGDSALADDKTAREVVIGDVMSGNRSRTNREARERRNKWLK